MKKVYLLVETENTYEATENIIAAFDFKPCIKVITDVISDYLTDGKSLDVEEYKAMYDTAVMYAQGILDGSYSDRQSFIYTLEEMELFTKEYYNIADDVYHG